MQLGKCNFTRAPYLFASRVNLNSLCEWLYGMSLSTALGIHSLSFPISWIFLDPLLFLHSNRRISFTRPSLTIISGFASLPIFNSTIVFSNKNRTPFIIGCSKSKIAFGENTRQRITKVTVRSSWFTEKFLVILFKGLKVLIIIQLTTSIAFSRNLTPI